MRSPGPFFEVPAGTPRQTCRSCSAPVYWIVTAGQRRMPVDCNVEGGVVPFRAVPGDGEAERTGRGVSHFATCPDAEQWRGGRTPR